MSTVVVSSMLLILGSCSKESASDEFEQANGKVAEKLVTRMDITSAQDSDDNGALFINYDSKNRVSSFTDGNDSTILVYEDDELSTISGGSEPMQTSEFYQMPYDIFQFGEVVEFDSNKNPSVIRLLEEDYNGNVYEYKVEISYDPTPNPFFYTLKAAGVIDVLDKVQFNLSMSPQSPDLIQARKLLPLNNIKKIVVTDVERGKITYQLVGDYIYDEDDYPTSASFTAISEDDGTNIFLKKYEYK
ncbi:hypothetical protein [Sediminicola sp. 1XM1-17]|uniref:hypothetical protein n=1 Tax=Sediminicola sp. 1XM1-17 TaxID=3127702 RepID=UPI0030777DE1